MSRRREREKKMYEQYSWSRHGPTARLHLSKINEVEVGVFSWGKPAGKYSNSSVIAELRRALPHRFMQTIEAEIELK